MSGIVFENLHEIAYASDLPRPGSFRISCKTAPYEPEKFQKFDDSKLSWDLLPMEELESTIKVLMFGAKKYGKDNWKLCRDKSRYLNALLRHIIAYQSGEYLDEESKLPHLAHTMCNLVFLTHLENRSEYDKKQ